MDNNKIKIRKMTPGDVLAGMQLSKAENWNQTDLDWEFILTQAANVCWAAEHDGRVIGTTTAVNYANQVAWISMVLVNPEFRGLGISKMLLRQTIQGLQGCRSIKLDATPAGHTVYKKFGFVDEYIIHRMTRLAGVDIVHPPKNVEDILVEGGNYIEEIVKMDRQVFGADRSMLIRRMIKQAPNYSCGLRKGGNMVGFTLGREGSRYFQIGPVCSQTYDEAKTLVYTILKDLEDRSVVIDIPSANLVLFDWFISQGFTSQRLFTRMYLGENLFPGITDKQALICGPEFG